MSLYQYLTSEEDFYRYIRDPVDYAPLSSYDSDEQYFNQKNLQNDTIPKYQYMDRYYFVDSNPQDELNPKYWYLTAENRERNRIEPDYIERKPVDNPPCNNINIDQLRGYILDILNGQNADFIENIVNIVQERIQNNIDDSLEESLAKAFSEIGIISDEEIDAIITNEKERMDN